MTDVAIEPEHCLHESLDAGLTQALAELATGHPLERVLETLATAIERREAGLMCSMLLLDDDGRLRHGAAPSLPAAYIEAIDGVAPGPSVGSCGTAAFHNRRVVVEDIEIDPLWGDYRELAARHGLRACWSEPIVSSRREVLGTFAMYYREPRRPVPHELRLIRRAAQLAGIAIERKRDEAVLRRAHEDLERRVAERTRRLEAANQRLAREAADRESAQVSLARREAHYRSVVDAARNVIICLDPSGRIIEWNRSAEDLYGWSRGEVLGESYSERFLPEAAREAVLADLSKILAGGATEGFENPVETRDRGERMVEWDVGPLVRDDGEIYGVIAVGHDVTTRHLADRRIAAYQEQLQSLASELALTEERERRRLGADLHDHISSTLGLTQIKLQSARAAAASEDLVEQLDECASLIDEAIARARSLMFDLSPPVLYELGLSAAVSWLVDQFQGRDGVRFVWADNREPESLPEGQRAILFRSVRELLVNVVKHAGAATCKVAICHDGDRVVVGVEDDGVGFDVSSPRNGLGLFSIREQITRLDGGFEIRSSPGEGTRALLWLPLGSAEGGSATAAS